MTHKKMIGMLGSSGSGKDTAAGFIKQALPGTVLLAFAEPLKTFAAEVFEFPTETIWGSSSRRNETFSEFGDAGRWPYVMLRLLRYAPDWCAKVLMTYSDAPIARKLYDKILGWFAELRAESMALESGLDPLGEETPHGLSCRRMLQTLGTECGRTVSPNIWANYGVFRAQEALRERECPAVVITDVRFVNEAQIMHAHSGMIWFMDRPVTILEGQAALHQSEAEIRSPEMQQYVTRTFKNGGSLEDLQAMIVKAVDETFERHPEWRM